MTRSGAYRHYAAVEYQKRNEDGAGGYLEQWKPLDECFISLSPVSARERSQAMKIAAEVTHRVTIRWRPDMPKQVRFVIGTRVFTQVGPWRNVDERNKDIELLCMEIIPETPA